jgi:hypothetical protein
LSLRRRSLHVPQAVSAQRLIYRLILKAFASAAAARSSINLRSPTCWTAMVPMCRISAPPTHGYLYWYRVDVLPTTWGYSDSPQGDKFLPINRAGNVLTWLHGSTSPTDHAATLTITRRTKTRRPGYTHKANFNLLHVISGSCGPRPSSRARLVPCQPQTAHAL